MKCLQNDKFLIETAKLNKENSINHIHGADEKYFLIC